MLVPNDPPLSLPLRSLVLSGNSFLAVCLSGFVGVGLTCDPVCLSLSSEDRSYLFVGLPYEKKEKKKS